MRHYDLLVPQNLLKIQQWFAEIITQPLIGEDQIYPFTPRGTPIQQEASEYICPSHTLSPWQRIEIYNQQYWWRLVKHMQHLYPALNCFLGVEVFCDGIAVPYLQSHPPSTWELNRIGLQLPGWLDKNYSKSNKQIVLKLAEIENATTRSFYSSKKKELVIENYPDLEALFHLTLKLQPDVFLFSFNSDVFGFKKALLKQEPSYWLLNEMVRLQKDKPVYHYILYQNAEKQVSWKEISPIFLQMLEHFKKENSLNHLCLWIEKQETQYQSLAAEQLMPFIQESFSKGWLYPLD